MNVLLSKLNSPLYLRFKGVRELSEYFYIPRGRVVFYKDTGRYTILHGGLKKRELNKIRKFFCIPKELTDYDTDFHYTMDDVNAIIK